MIRVLIIEDDASVQRAVRRMLSRSTHPIFQMAFASNLADAEALLCNKPNEFDVVLSDINLPDGNSPTLYAKLRESLAQHSIRWVAMTGAADAAEIDYYTSEGVTVLRKPFVTSQLVIDALREAFMSK